MKASVYLRNRQLDVEDRPVPFPRPGEALLHIQRVGICGSDLHIFQGHLDHRVPERNTIGHEVLAEVVEVPGGARVAKGDRVVINPIVSCGDCGACKMGASYLCYKLKVLGVDAPGGMQEYWAVAAENLIPVPAAVGDDDAAMLEPLAVATHDVARAEVKAGDRVVVFGGGPIGTLIALVCREKGAHVKVVEINPFRLKLIQGIGLETIGPGEDTVAAVRDWTGGTGADVVFEVTGDPAMVTLLTRVVRVWGTVSVIAIHSEPVPIDLYPVFAREIKLHGSRLYTKAAWDEAIRLAAARALPLAALVTGRVKIDGIQRAMEEALSGGPVMKVLVDMDGD
jgi:(R,R)-butanediol dehydrogenase / meso-butanediol dehydrogenase / diacetyl reductase